MKRIGKECGWKHPRAPLVRLLWKERATEAVLEFLRDARAGRRAAVMVTIGPQEDRGEESERRAGDEESGPAPP